MKISREDLEAVLKHPSIGATTTKAGRPLPTATLLEKLQDSADFLIDEDDEPVSELAGKLHAAMMEDEEIVVTGDAAEKPATKKTKKKSTKKPAAEEEAEEETPAPKKKNTKKAAAVEAEPEEEEEPAPKKKAKKKVVKADAEDDTEAEPAPKKKRKPAAEKKPTANRDAFNSREGSIAYAINTCLSKKSRTVAEIADLLSEKEIETTPTRVRDHLRRLSTDGLIEQNAKGYKLLAK